MSVIFIASLASDRGKAFCKVNQLVLATIASNLTARGYTVLNPALLPDGLTYEQHLHISFAMLRVADEIYLPDDWQYSQAAKAEYALAKKRGLKISTPTSRKRGASC